MWTHNHITSSRRSFLAFGVSVGMMHACLLFNPGFAQAASCDSLAGLKLPDTTITLAQTVGNGKFQPPKHPWPTPESSAGITYDKLPDFCRVAATIAPTKDSQIKMEVWMPASGWNGKFQGVGNGLWSGEIYYWLMALALRAGYATASTDTGHEGPAFDLSFALGHPEKVIDFGHRATHEMTVKAKAILSAFYGSGARVSYFNACSGGGRQSLQEAQRYPLDYEGIIAGAPGINMTRMTAPDLDRIEVSRKGSAGFIPLEKYELIHRAVLDACDANDGVKDGVIENPMRCRFDPKALQCKGPDGDDCLTAPQVETVRKRYRGNTNPRTGEKIFEGVEPGSELGWGQFQIYMERIAGLRRPGLPGDYYRYIVYKNRDWDYRTFNYDRDIALGDKTDNGTINATNPDLKAFVANGGKLLLYHGWSDPGVPPRATINYYNDVRKTVANSDKSVRLFMVPGMGHCSGGEGPTEFDEVGVMDEWREKGKAPDRIIASRRKDGQVDRTRPLCPYPQVAKYKGKGSTDDAANFVCATER